MIQVTRAESVTSRPLKRLNFDIEARPLGWLGGGWVHQEVTAIGWCWMDGNSEPEVATLTKRANSAKTMLRRFWEVYTEADMVVGHYIRGYDLPTLQAEYIELGLPLLGSKLTHDTYSDLVKHKGISKSQETMSAMLGLQAPKVQMNVSKWREANRLTNAGIQLTIERVVGDVRQNMELHAALMERKLLGPPKLWTPSTD